MRVGYIYGIVLAAVMVTKISPVWRWIARGMFTSRVCPLHAVAGNSFFSPGMAVNLLDLALQYKGGKCTLRLNDATKTLPGLLSY